MKRDTKDQTGQFFYLNGKEVKTQNTNNYTATENTEKVSISAIAEKEFYRYPYYKKVLAYELELY